MTGTASETTPVIVVNGRCLTRPVTGVERYATEVLRHLPVPVRIVAPARMRAGAAGHAWEQFRLPALVAAHALLWSPANTGPVAVRRQVLTLHDVSPLDHPEWFSRPFAAWYRFLLPRLARSVTRIITSSAFSRGRIIDKLGAAPDRVVVIPAGVASRFSPASAADVETVRTRYQLERPFALAVGSLEPRKNLPRLFRAWALVRRSVPDAQLAVVGAARFNFASAGIGVLPEGIRLLDAVPDADLAALYTGAVALVAVSLYEGFGLPALEAMACGAAVVASKGTAMEEVVGSDAVKVDPRSEQSIAAGILSIAGDERRRQELQRAGFGRAKMFGWDRTAERVWSVLRDAAAHD